MTKTAQYNLTLFVCFIGLMAQAVMFCVFMLLIEHVNYTIAGDIFFDLKGQHQIGAVVCFIISSLTTMLLTHNNLKSIWDSSDDD